MKPPVFQTLKNSHAVIDALWWSNAPIAAGGDHLKVYEYGMAPQGVADPYCVWQIQGGSPNNFLDRAPNTDLFAVQFDIYGASGLSVRAAAKAIRDAIEPRIHITSWLGESIDPQTKRYRFTFSSDWWVNR